MVVDFTALEAQVANTVGVEASAILVIQTIASEIAAAVAADDATTANTVAGLSVQLSASANALAAAVATVPVSNTAPVSN